MGTSIGISQINVLALLGGGIMSVHITANLTKEKPMKH